MYDDYRLIIEFAERIHRWSQGKLRRQLGELGVNDIGPGPAAVLFDLRDECISVTELARRGAYHPPNLSSSITDLQQAGYINYERAAHDKRVRLVSLTEKGRRLVEALIPLQRHDAADLVTLAGADALVSFGQALQRLEHAVRAEEGQGAAGKARDEGLSLSSTSVPFLSQGTRSSSPKEPIDIQTSSDLAASPEQQSPVDHEALIRALMDLPPEQREALILTRAEDLSYEEASLVCGVAVGTIKSRIARGRERLSDLLPKSARLVL
jgi:DNA-binding MarR family transcriptional regulator/predicted DNA-binding protein (UPF0251 family)